MSQLKEIKNAQLRSEFLRAVNLVVTTQLTLFLDREKPTRDSIVNALKQKLDLMQEKDAEPTTELMQAAVMRDVLREAIDVFNDPFAAYISPEQLNRYYNKRKGNLLGIGVKFRAYDDEYPIVLGALLGGPLEQTRLAPGDRIIEIEGTDQLGASSRDVSGALKGDKDSSVNLKLRDSEGLLYDLDATRSQIKLRYARAEMLANKIGYIRISRFGGDTHLTVRGLVQGLLEREAEHLILDLRDNPGGSTRAARGIVSLFVDQQSVYCERYETGGIRKLPHEGDKLTDLPLVVLVNEASMSASEIVAGALQDYDRALIIGAPTYGKGLIQKVFNLKAPLGGAVRTTIAAYATPSQTLIHGVGVTPEIYEATAPDNLFSETGSLNVSAAARNLKRQLLEDSLRERYEDDPEQAEMMIALQDRQLQKGIETLLP